MTRSIAAAVAQGILGGIIVLAVRYALARPGQAHQPYPVVFYPHHHHPVHVIRWITRPYGR